MGFREKMNDNPGAVAAVVGVVILLMVLLMYLQFRTPKSNLPKPATQKDYFSDDDGQTFYVDDKSNIPPYDHDGKKAYTAAVFMTADGDKFIGYLESYDPADKSAIEAAIKSGKSVDVAIGDFIPNVKKPGGKAWVKPKIGNKPNPEYERVIANVPPGIKKEGLSARLRVSSVEAQGK